MRPFNCSICPRMVVSFAVDGQHVLGFLGLLPHFGQQLAQLLFGRLQVGELGAQVAELLGDVLPLDVLLLDAHGCTL